MKIKKYNSLYYDDYMIVKKGESLEFPRMLAELYPDELEEIRDVIKELLKKCPK